MLTTSKATKCSGGSYASYAAVAQRHGLPIQLGTPTWRASRNWTPDVERLNAAGAQFLREIAASSQADVIVAGVIGPASDGYSAAQRLSEDDALAYHREQAQALARCGVDLLYAPTFPAFGELLGAARALAQTGVPYALAPMLNPDGTMIDGTPLGEAISRIDANVSPRPSRYMIGCLYPTHAQTALEATRKAYPDAVKRVRGLKANASPLPAEELDKLGCLSATDAQTFARDEVACARAFDLQILGGCCGTDDRDIAAIAASLFVIVSEVELPFAKAKGERAALGTFCRALRARRSTSLAVVRHGSP